uniref:Protein kinase domain-containing protein n=1 Tax=Globodera rostochiensis TaxID=31243 RepID=A0A914HN18_GLORO
MLAYYCKDEFHRFSIKQPNRTSKIFKTFAAKEDGLHEAINLPNGRKCTTRVPKFMFQLSFKTRFLISGQLPMVSAQKFLQIRAQRGERSRLEMELKARGREVISHCREATTHVRDYNELRLLEQMVDSQGITVEETLLVSRVSSPALRYALRIIEMRNEDAFRAVFHEITILKKLELHDNIMGLFAAFRHRQYMGLLQPPFATLQDKIELLYRKSGGQTPILFRDPLLEKKWNEDISESRSREFLLQIGIFGKDAVVYVLRRVLSGLEYLNSKLFVHTHICASSVFVDEHCSIKLGSFLHVRRIRSTKWEFTGNPSRLPPEAFRSSHSAQNVIKSNFDTWSIGLFVLEMITRKQLQYTREEMQQIAEQFIDGTQEPPTLAEIEPSTVADNQQQLYDPHIDSFLATCFTVDPAARPIPSELLNHPFMSRQCIETKARINVGVESKDAVQWNTKRRSLRLEMMAVHSYYGQLKERDLVFAILNAISLVKEGTHMPIFTENLSAVVRSNFVAVDASLAFQQGEEWSRDVLNISNASPSPEEVKRQKEHKTPHRSGEQISRGHNNRFPQEEREYQRCEMVFFVNRNWSREHRQLFVAYQFARWFLRGLICFPDLVRIVDELDDILIDHMLCLVPRPFSPYKTSSRTAPPDSVAFISGLRRSLYDPDSVKDPETHKFNNIYVEVVLSKKLLKKKLDKFNQLREGDPVELPPNVDPLCASATFYDLNMRRLDVMETVLLGERRVRDWEFKPEQRFVDSTSPSTQLTTLLNERRRNPNMMVDSEISWEASNQARRAKIWGDYTRDFMYRFARYHVPYQISEDSSAKVFGRPRLQSSTEMLAIEPLNSVASEENSPKELDELQMQLLRTRSKQEEDFAVASKTHDDVELRRRALMHQLGHEKRQKVELFRDLTVQLEELCIRFRQAETNLPVPPGIEKNRADLERFPKHRR